ncbi:MAG: hypothetical protein PUC87_05530 [Galactobacillus timonensis]|uniref:hypothetical protein n=1 Tax=Clostridium vitabionis TaxID=2784388 RepID=UPI00188CBE13|nr:hypothetical protein [Clostridium vitabionis]MDD5851594.1 hypothetical protein [Galactobacillus timonensis]
MNGEKYPDPTADIAVRNADRIPDNIAEVIRLMKSVASLAGLDVTNRIHLRDRATGKEWK